ncbi:hypothetical protein SAMN05518672_101278 [Chitinophaga sp. CF118]|uniref:HYC_CC_PP family protein n=1 Tax=Chitinophaga sp. CF118 TaxID=1884367 RepID=UPI0008E28390|nr:hypothetical protein [Chitinophaga sp. CF118]SFD06117.1 hypothetical protein SAMN05518672_101278 [Chitinophaga sp. CF118]
MKKFTIILLAILYTAITSGFTVHAHYCMGKLAELSFKSPVNDACNKCGKSGKCCKDEFKYCKVTVQHETSQVQQTIVPAEKYLHLPVIIVPVPSINISTSLITYNDHAPPGDDLLPLYIQYCTCRI